MSCKTSLSLKLPLLGLAQTFPERESLKYKIPSLPLSSKAFKTLLFSSIVTFVPAVRYKPASTVQSLPNEIPIPEFAQSKHLSPTLITSSLPPDRVPMVEHPPPRSESLPMKTPADILPSIILGPSVPAL